jgi:tripartite-type tricarboxylate transporter receptor subunit TctC
MKGGDKMKYRIFLWKIQVILSLIFFCLVLQATNIQAQEPYPNRPITFIVGYAAGGPTDITTRVLSDAASKMLGQPIPVINKPGGTSSVALSTLMAEKPDGYTIGVMPTGGILTSLLRKVPYDPVKDFTHIIQYGYYQDGIAVRADSPWKTFKELIEYAKNNPGKTRYASAGAGTPEHLIMERLSIGYGIKWLHLPYEGDAPAAVALLGGHVDVVSTSSGCWKPHVESGKFRLLVTFHEKRMDAFPNVPTLRELGYDMTAAVLICIVGPKGLPEPVVVKLHDVFRKSMEDTTFIKTMERLGVGTHYRGPQELKQFIQKIVDEEGETIQKLGLRK